MLKSVTSFLTSYFLFLNPDVQKKKENYCLDFEICQIQIGKKVFGKISKRLYYYIFKGGRILFQLK